ncbi:MAG: SRPBCC domain-containing protein [Chelatococcus sp.]|uniref:SRPBCC domain-containing protein n=1 Tax=Chelatococcus sp. TaxID=1953771 RepID=UPI0025B8C4CC|nr:SRPBCC domain-containing protein [Chelatococcus sp.]MBX3540844.1 SRPBCC domain-containing protein [Chelatococcus sp.]
MTLEPRDLRLVRTFDTSPQALYAAWTEPSLARRWLFTSPESEKNSHELDVRVGGRWTITDRRDGQDYTAVGEYTAVDAPHRLAFTFAMPQFSPNSDLITVEFEPDGDHTRMVFTQAGDDIAKEIAEQGEDAEAGTAHGWALMFDRLAGLFQLDERPGEKIDAHTVRFERLLPGPIERVWAYLTESDKRGQWLASGAMPSTPGASFTIRFDHMTLSPHKLETPTRFKDYECGIDSPHRMLRCEPPHVLAFTWGDGIEDKSEVLFELSQVGDKVRLVLTHSRLGAVKDMINVSGGWQPHLAVLAHRLAGLTPPSFWQLFEGVEDAYAGRFSA